MTEMERIAEKFSDHALYATLCPEEETNIGSISKRYDDGLRAALREFGELACKAVCWMCDADAYPNAEQRSDGWFYHEEGIAYQLCHASAIRKLMASEIEREGK